MINQKSKSKKMVKTRKIDISLEVRFVPLAPEQVHAWRAGNSNLANILKGINPDGPKDLILEV